MKTFVEAKCVYDSITDRMRELSVAQIEALREMQELCPHANTTVIRDSDFLPDFLRDEDEEPVLKCKDCGKVLRQYN
ncbi:hypothetical protein ACOJUR_11995 [Alicyclobacillus tolerans]|uniref:hypothetical protein n=1 Tax=Alicyclobacillus tolerans TaxID=90970 RepID=UPI003B7E26E5